MSSRKSLDNYQEIWLYNSIHATMIKKHFAIYGLWAYNLLVKGVSGDRKCVLHVSKVTILWSHYTLNIYGWSKTIIFIYEFIIRVLTMRIHWNELWLYFGISCFENFMKEKTYSWYILDIYNTVILVFERLVYVHNLTCMCGYSYA